MKKIRSVREEAMREFKKQPALGYDFHCQVVLAKLKCGYFIIG